ncbi:hypothetical protein [Bradyrhizobium sp. th.b2]|uniref:hypothetical protein n=1 Tax=Bradyrhizobium sp. th-b2 TaxID=172088 RepID=UPI000490BF42|nr:hypothetical protein [Bradyrhizobium sp. th.b2]
MIKATELARPLLPFPELLDRENALRKALAGQVPAKTMSLFERNVQIEKLHSQLLEEERSRKSAAPADAGKPPLSYWPMPAGRWVRSVIPQRGTGPAWKPERCSLAVFHRWMLRQNDRSFTGARYDHRLSGLPRKATDTACDAKEPLVGSTLMLTEGISCGPRRPRKFAANCI